jgi:hypothetical protein
MAMASFDDWMSLYGLAYSSVDRLSTMECPNCGVVQLNLVFVIYGTDDHDGHAAFWCGACLHGVAPGPASVPSGAMTVRREMAKIPAFRIVPPPGAQPPITQ